MVNPKGTPEEVEAVWQDFHRVLELLRVLFDDAANWTSTFTSSFAGMLTVRERLALPGQAQKYRFTG